jgi:hypothetical protein
VRKHSGSTDSSIIKVEPDACYHHASAEGQVHQADAIGRNFGNGLGRSFGIATLVLIWCCDTCTVVPGWEIFGMHFPFLRSFLILCSLWALYSRMWKRVMKNVYM